MSSGDLIIKSIEGIWISRNENTDNHYADYVGYIKPLLTAYANVNIMTTDFRGTDENSLAIIAGTDQRVKYMKNPLAVYGHIEIFGSDEFAQSFIDYMNAY